MKQAVIDNKNIKKSPKIMFWRYYLYVLLLAIVIAATILIAKNV